MDAVILKVAQALNEAQIFWGIGASILLKKHGLTDVTHDIDLVVSSDTMDRAMAVLNEIAQPKTPPQNAVYATKRFLQYELDGVSLDVMSDFIINHSAGAYKFPFDKKSLVDRVQIDGIELPYTSLEDWFIAYQLMGREKRAERIWKYFMENGIRHPELIERALVQKMPPHFVQMLERLLESNRTREQDTTNTV